MLTSGTSETSGLGRARRPRPSLTVVVFVVALVAVWPLAGARALSRAAVAPESLPQRLSDAEFWRLTIDLSEPNGSFRSENLVSNEHTYQYVIPSLIKTVKPGGVYLGVAPDQNFTYMIAVQPKLAFIVDIRRGNLLQHLMYKAIFELSTDRADFCRASSPSRVRRARPEDQRRRALLGVQSRRRCRSSRTRRSIGRTFRRSATS